MTDNKSYREKGRAVFLAAMMVLSVFAGAAAFTGAAAANHTAEDSPNADAAYSASSTNFDNVDVFVGQEITLNDLSSNEFVEVTERSSGNVVKTVRADSSSSVTIDFSDIDEGYYYFNGSDGSITQSDGVFQVVEQNLDASFTTDTVRSGDDATLNISSDNRNSKFDVALTVDGLDGSDLKSAIGAGYVDDDDSNVLVVPDAAGNHQISTDDLDTGNLSVNVEVTDSTASDSANVEVVEDQAEQISFTQSGFEVQNGNEGEISFTTSSLSSDTVHLSVGDTTDANYKVILNISGLSNVDNGEQVNISYNTAEDPKGAAWSSNTEDVSVDDVNVTEGASIPLEAYDYELTIGSSTNVEDGELVVSNERDSAYLQITERNPISSDALATWTAPASDDIENAEDLADTTLTQTDTIAKDDHLLVSIEADSVYGFVDEGDRLHNFSENADASITIEEQEAGANAEPTVWQTYGFTNSNESINATVVSADEEAGQFVLAVEGNSSESPEELEAGQTYDVTYKLGAYNQFVDSAEKASGEFSIEERNVEWDDSAEEVPNTADAEVTGTTNVAPGTEVDTRARASGAFVDYSSTVVEAGDDTNTFAADYDFSGEEVGTEFDLRATLSTGEQAETTSTLVEEDTEPEAETMVSFGQDTYEVTKNDTTEVTIDVTAGADGLNTSVPLMVNGDEVDSQSVSLKSEASTSVAFDIDTSSDAYPVGEHDLSTSVDNASGSAILNISEDTSGSDDSGSDDSGSDDSGSDDSGSDDSGSDDSGSDDSGSDDSGSDDSGSDDSGSDGQPGFGISVAILSLLGAALLAFRKNE